MALMVSEIFLDINKLPFGLHKMIFFWSFTLKFLFSWAANKTILEWYFWHWIPSNSKFSSRSSLIQLFVFSKMFVQQQKFFSISTRFKRGQISLKIKFVINSFSLYSSKSGQKKSNKCCKVTLTFPTAQKEEEKKKENQRYQTWVSTVLPFLRYFYSKFKNLHFLLTEWWKFKVTK